MENTKKRQQRVFITCGIPGSGKSTIIQQLWQQNGGHYISRDEVRFSMLKDKDAYFDKEDKVFEDFIKLIRGSMSSGEDVYIDATHLTPKARHKTLVRIPSGDYETIAVCVEVPVKVAFERNAKREGRANVPETVIRNMAASYKRPTFEENWFDEIWIYDENMNYTKVKRVNNNE